MIRHVVFFRAIRPEDRDAVLAGLSLLKRNPHATRLEVVPNGKRDQLGNEIDVVVYGEFVDEAALTAYKAHPIYEESIQQVRPLRDLRFAADFELPGD